jgi:hypothetical protein
MVTTENKAATGKRLFKVAVEQPEVTAGEPVENKGKRP